MKRGPKTVEEFMALPVVGLFDEEVTVGPHTGITHHKRVARKASAMFLDADTIFAVTDKRTGERWVLHGEGRRLVL